MQEYLRKNVKEFYKQKSLIIDNDKKVYEVVSCLDLKWLLKGRKKGYYLTAKYLYTEEKNE